MQLLLIKLYFTLKFINLIKYNILSDSELLETFKPREENLNYKGK